ncbi:hypothetical protein [Wenyingzhuangia sp. IMCC45467]
MKAYYYLLFRIYKYFEGIEKKKNSFNISPKQHVIVESTFILYIILISIITYLEYLNYIPKYNISKIYIVLIMFIIGLINYLFFLKGEKYLKMGFKKDLNGGIVIVSFLLLILFLFLNIASKNRETIFSKINSEKSNEFENNIKTIKNNHLNKN